MTWEELKSPRVWIPEEKDEEIEGVIVDWKEGAFGKQWLIDTNGELVFTPSSKLLGDFLDNFNIGHRVRISYRGERDVKKGNPLRLYTVFKWKDNNEEEVKEPPLTGSKEDGK